MAQSLTEFNYLLEMSKKAGFVDNIYFSKNILKRYFVRKNLTRILDNAIKLPSRFTVLDFGPGYGALLSVLSKHYKSVIGVDIDDQQIKKAAKLIEICKTKNVELILQNEENELKQFNDNYFDCVIANNVLEHIDISQSKLILEKFFSILKPNGTLLVSLPSENFIYRVFESQHDGHVLRSSKEINALISLISSYFSLHSKFDVFPFFKNCVFIKSYVVNNQSSDNDRD